MSDIQSGSRRNEYLALIRLKYSYLHEKFGVDKIGVFGSTVRGEDQDGSDVDVVFTFCPGKVSLDRYLELADYLESLFGRKVDLIPDDGLSPYIRPFVMNEVVWCEA
ncbi:nucleotidyltransferase family protein [Methanocorpusculum sp. MG]|uniref:protein adenylyltransferase n=1 Tax=Methanocorpusculum petauri TaxID=3002863 RepID=A0ABT4IHG8_9EURY|nr:nucleotidyltransferase family protein [Methanocorpusculum petauri]MCZ0860809.1 nucleotidyltransferase family protein [Methanocorpusculum petauri]MDE2443300.1 nucleotidyltransferase family protein [Methanocorpusculum sp.]